MHAHALYYCFDFFTIIHAVPKNPNMTQEQLRELILADESLISARVALLTVAGLPCCNNSEKKPSEDESEETSSEDKSEEKPGEDKSEEKSSLAMKLLERQFKMTHDDLMRVAGIKEEDKEFCLFEVGAVRDESTGNWEWYQFKKRSGYISCFVSALESNKDQATGKLFDYQPRKQYMFDNEALDNCFHNVYQLLSAFYNQDMSSVPTEKLAGGAALSLINVWDIGFNRAILHFLILLSGYLHHNFPILTLRYPNDVEHLTESFDISQNKLLKGLKPILDQYSRAKFLLTFSHLGRSSNCKREGVCQVVSILDPPIKRQQDKNIGEDLKEKILIEAKKFGADHEDLISDCPWIIDQDNNEDLDILKNKLDCLISSKQQDKIPLSWFFLRSAFFKTGQLYIETSKLEQHARKCKITADKFKVFLSRFTGFGSIIHIPDIPLLCNYVILNPPDFFHKLTELFYPRFNGDLQYGIASFSTLRRLFGEDLQFFCNVLTSCNFAVKIVSNRIVYAKEQTRLPIAEPCLYIPGMRTEVASQDNKLHKKSLFLVYEKALLPTHTTLNVVKYLLESKRMENLCLVTCDCYTITQLALYSHLTEQMPTPPTSTEKQQPLTPVFITMISHLDKNELCITNDNETATDVKKEVVKAYRYAEKVYSDYHYKLLGIKSEFEFALVCQDTDEHHTITADTACPRCCKDNEAMWEMWRQVLET